jgi:hypothetical protein
MRAQHLSRVSGGGVDDGIATWLEKQAVFLHAGGGEPIGGGLEGKGHGLRDNGMVTGSLVDILAGGLAPAIEQGKVEAWTADDPTAAGTREGNCAASGGRGGEAEGVVEVLTAKMGDESEARRRGEREGDIHAWASFEHGQGPRGGQHGDAGGGMALADGAHGRRQGKGAAQTAGLGEEDAHFSAGRLLVS